VTKPDVLIENGVVHGISSLLVPTDFQMTSLKVLLGFGNQKLVTALQQTTLDQLFDGSAELQYTIFAPTEEALAKISNETWRSQLTLTDLLELHIVKGRILQIKEGQVYAPLIPGYLLVGGKGGQSLICMNLTYFHAQEQSGMNIENGEQTSNDHYDTQGDGKKRSSGLQRTRRTDSITPGGVYEAKILNQKVTPNGVVFQIDGAFGLHTTAKSTGRWIILGIIIAFVVLLIAVGIWLWRRRQQQQLAASRSHVRLLD